MPAPDSNENDPMEEALRRDAGRIVEPPFDPTLHYATIRRIRALGRSSATPSRFRFGPLIATAAVLVIALFLLSRSPQPKSHTPPRETIQAAPSSSLLAYEEASARGDDALSAMLDREAQTLLPASPAIFNTRLP